MTLMKQNQFFKFKCIEGTISKIKLHH